MVFTLLVPGGGYYQSRETGMQKKLSGYKIISLMGIQRK